MMYAARLQESPLMLELRKPFASQLAHLNVPPAGVITTGEV